MSISKVAWAVGVWSALCLGGCVLDTTTVDEDDANWGMISWDLTEDDAPSGGEEEDDEDGLGTNDRRGELDGPGQDPTERARRKTDPHPDPWHCTDEQSEGVGNND